MAENGQEKIVAFDTLFTTNQIQVLKILLTYVEPSQQKLIAVYIKFLELQYTLSFFEKHPRSFDNYPKEELFDIGKLCEEIIPFCAPSEREKINQMKNMYQNFTNMQEMMQMVQMMKDFFPEGDNPLNGSPADMDISQIFEMFQAFNN